MRIGILGTGEMGKTHANIYKRFPDVALIGMAGRDEIKTKEVANFIETKAFGSAYDLIHSEEVDAIDVCYPSAVHKEYVVEALNSGKDVFCETPLAYTVEDAEAMLAAARRNKKLLMVALFDRFQSQYRHIAELIKSGQWGKPKAFFANRRSPAYFASNDIVINMMIHDFDFLSMLVGKPKAVIGLGVANSKGVNEQVNVLLEYDGITAMIEGSAMMPKSFPFSTSLRVVCEKAAVELNWHWGEHGPISDLTLYPAAGSPQKLQIPDYDPYEAECRYFVDAVQGRVDPQLLGIEAACESLKIAVAARESFRQNGKRIEVS
ncbi:MAG TPA: Gfo/Idh/MocA family oxidoreductase [Bacillota bacterium]|nr:Gfo/Idh/MocA family oxidoreductase [Bacillota bacterium]